MFQRVLRTLLITASALCISLSAAGPVSAQTPVVTYGQHLLETAAASHPGISGLEIVLPKLDATGPRALLWGKKGKAVIDLPLQDVTGTQLGQLHVTFPPSTILTATQQKSAAESIRDDLRRHTLDATNLVDPYPFDAHFSQQTYGQHVVDEIFAEHHDVLVLGLHAKPSDDAPSAILASSFGRIGKLDDAGDLKVVTSGPSEPLITKAGNRCNIGVPLQNILGHTIGLLTVGFPYADGDSKAALSARALSLRNEVSQRLLNRGSLIEKYPLDAAVPAHTYAQALVEQLLREHPNAIGIALHVTPPGRKDNLILASTFGRVGQLSDESDLAMIRSGKHNMHVLPSGERYSGELTLRDSARRDIGAMLTIFPYQAGDDTAALLTEAKQMRQEIATRIQNVAELLRPQ